MKHCSSVENFYVHESSLESAIISLRSSAGARRRVKRINCAGKVRRERFASFADEELYVYDSRYLMFCSLLAHPTYWQIGQRQTEREREEEEEMCPLSKLCT